MPTKGATLSQLVSSAGEQAKAYSSSRASSTPVTSRKANESRKRQVRGGAVPSPKRMRQTVLRGPTTTTTTTATTTTTEAIGDVQFAIAIRNALFVTTEMFLGGMPLAELVVLMHKWKNLRDLPEDNALRGQPEPEQAIVRAVKAAYAGV